MNETPRVLFWPESSGNSPEMALYVLLCLLLVLIVISVLHRRRRQGEELSRAWQSAMTIAGNRGLSEAERNVFQALLRRWAPDAPLRAVRDRDFFEQVLDAETRALTGETLERLLAPGKLLFSVRHQLGFARVPLDESLHTTRQIERGQVFTLYTTSPVSVRLRDSNAFYFVAEAMGEQPLIQRGDRVGFRFSRAGDARYEFAALCLGTEPGHPGIAFLHTNTLKRLQSRANERIDFEVLTIVEILDPAERGEEEPRRLLQVPAWGEMEADIIDISAVGVAMKSELSVPAGLFIRFAIALDGGPPPLLLARVIECSPSATGRHLLRAEYVGLGPATHGKLARYVRYRQEKRIPPPA